MFQKRILSIILCLSMIFTMSHISFADVNNNHNNSDTNGALVVSN